MGDSLEYCAISFFPKIDPLEHTKATNRIRVIAHEHQYARLNIRTRCYVAHNYQSIEITFNVPDRDGDPDGFHRCDLEVFMERVVVILRSMFGAERFGNWEISTKYRLP